MHGAGLYLLPAAEQPAPAPRSLEVVGGVLMICTDSGCRVIEPADLIDAVRLLPELLARQHAEIVGDSQRRAKRSAWHAMAESQRGGKA
jgi:hypothetical protein